MQHRRKSFIVFTTLIVMLALFVTMTSAAVTTLGDGSIKLTASDASGGDRFGAAVDIDQNTAIIGAVRDDDAGSSSGSAYVFVRDINDGTWSEQQKLTASDAAAGEEFGTVVAVDGDTAVVGVPLEDDAVTLDTGAVYVFVRDTNTGIWTEQQKITLDTPVASDEFGGSVDVSGDTLIVGARLRDAVTSDSGAAFVYTRDTNTGIWSLEQQLLGNDTGGGDRLGFSVGLDGDVAVVGAPTQSSNSGSAYVFTRSGTTWTEEAKLVSTTPASNAFFGTSIAVSGLTVAVGSDGDASAGAETGAVFAFVGDGSGNWDPQQKLTASDAATGDKFGGSVSVSGDSIMVGAALNDDDGASSGSAYLFIRKDGTWYEQAKILAFDALGADEFGESVAISGNTGIAGARFDDDDGSSSGSAYIVNATPDTKPPSAPAITAYAEDTGSSDSDDITSDNELVVSGIAEAGTTVTLSSNVDGIVGSAIADVNNAWSITTSVLSDDTHTLTATAADSVNNVSDPSTALIVTVDTQSPTVSVPAGITQDTDAGVATAVVSFTATVEDNLEGATVNCVPASGSTFTLGETTVTCTGTDVAGNTDAPTFTVSIEDNEAPVITLNGDATVDVEFGAGYTDEGATVTDNVDNDLTAVVGGDTIDASTPVGTYQITYDATDSAGNSAVQVVRTVNVVDTTPPVLTLIGDAVVNVQFGEGYTDDGATADDNVDGDITDNIVVGGDTIDANTPTGNYQITYNVTDNAGNSATQLVRTVIVGASGPFITSTIPTNGAEDVALNSDITFNLSEAIAVTGPPLLSFTCQPGGETIGFTISQDGATTYIFNPTNDLPETSTCTLSFSTAALTNTNGAELIDNDGNDDGTYTLTFETFSIPPAITGVSPLPGATGVAVDANITLTLNEIPTAVSALPTLTCDAENQPYGVVVNQSLKQAIFNPNSDLPFGASCTLAITTSTIADADGNNLVDNDGTVDGTVNLSFTTEDAPAVISSNPSSGATDVSVNTPITLTTNEQMFATGNGLITLNCGGDNITFGLTVPNVTTYILTPNVPLDAGATCTLNIPVTAARDADGNLLAGNDENGENYVLTFTTAAANAAPAVEAAPMIEGTE